MASLPLDAIARLHPGSSFRKLGQNFERIRFVAVACSAGRSAVRTVGVQIERRWVRESHVGCRPGLAASGLDVVGSSVSEHVERICTSRHRMSDRDPRCACRNHGPLVGSGNARSIKWTTSNQAAARSLRFLKSRYTWFVCDRHELIHGRGVVVELLHPRNRSHFARRRVPI